MKEPENILGNKEAYSVERMARINELCDKIERLRENQGFTEEDLVDARGTLLVNWKHPSLRHLLAYARNLRELAKDADNRVLELVKADPEEAKRIMREGMKVK